MQTTVNLSPGVFFAGISRPWYASKGAVRSELEKRFQVKNVRIYPRATALPAGVNPKADPLYSDSWEEWIRADYAGPVLQLQSDRVWAWMVRVNSTSATPAMKAPPPEPPGDDSSASVLVLAPVALGFYLWWRHTRG